MRGEERHTIAIYVRISSEDDNDGESNSIKNQRDLLYEYINNSPELSASQVLEFVDDGYTGTSFDRPRMNDLLAVAKEGIINCIIVKDLSRMGRNYLDMGKYLEQIFPFLGIRFIAVNDNYDSKRNAGSLGSIEIPFKNLINELYSKDLSKKTTAAIRTLMEQGKYIGAFVPYGYCKNKDNKQQLAIDIEAATVVERIFKMYIDGASVTDIAKQFNKEGILTPAQHKKKNEINWYTPTNKRKLFWRNNMVSIILKDERYTGKMVYGKKGNGDRPKKEIITVKNTHEAIVSQEDYTKAQELIERKKLVRAPSTRKEHVLSNIRCGGCGDTLQRSSSRSTKFYCVRRRFTESNNCFSQRILVETIEIVVFESIKKHLEVIISVSEINEEKTRLKTNEREIVLAEIKTINQKLAKAKLKKISLYEQYKGGNVERQKYLKRVIECEDDISATSALMLDLKKRVQSVERIKDSEQVKNAAKYLALPKLTKKIYNEFVEAVYVYHKDKIEVFFKCQDEYAKIE